VTDSNAKPVSTTKKGAGATVPGGKVDMPRPPMAVALAAVLVLSGLAAIVAGLLLTGHKGYLVHTLTKNNPPVTAAQATSAQQKVAAAIGKALPAGASVSATTITTVGDKAADVLGDKDVIPGKNISSNDRKDQQKKVRAAVSAELKVGTSVTSATSTSVATSVGQTVHTDLVALNKKQHKKINDNADKLPKSQVVSGIVLTIALGFVGFGAYAGRYWTRWAVPIVWVLCSFTGTSAGITSLLQIGGDSPGGFRAGAAISSAALIVGVILTFLAPTRAWFEAHRPVAPAGAPQRRGLFAPRIPPPSGGGGGRPVRGRDEIPADGTRSSDGKRSTDGKRRPSAAKAATDRTPTKKRVEPVAVSTETSSTDTLSTDTAATKPSSARTRPRQASKSRRTES